MEMECAQIEGVIANQCAHWCGNPPVLPRTIGFDLIRPTGTFPSQGKAYAYKNALRRKAGGRIGYEIQGFPTGMSVFSRIAWSRASRFSSWVKR